MANQKWKSYDTRKEDQLNKEIHIPGKQHAALELMAIWARIQCKKKKILQLKNLVI